MVNIPLILEEAPALGLPEAREALDELRRSRTRTLRVGGARVLAVALVCLALSAVLEAAVGPIAIGVSVVLAIAAGGREILAVKSALAGLVEARCILLAVVAGLAHEVRRASLTVTRALEIVASDLHRLAWLLEVGGQWLVLEERPVAAAPLLGGKPPRACLDLVYHRGEAAWHVLVVNWSGAELVCDALHIEDQDSERIQGHGLPCTVSALPKLISLEATEPLLGRILVKTSESIWRVEPSQRDSTAARRLDPRSRQVQRD